MEQKVIFNIKLKENDQMGISIEFNPGIPGEEKYKELTKEQKYLLNYAGEIAEYVMDALKSNNEKKQKGK